MSLGTPQYLAILCKAAILALMRILCLAVMLSAGVAINEAAATSLKPIEQGALQATLDAVAKRLMVPGAWYLCARRGSVSSRARLV